MTAQGFFEMASSELSLVRLLLSANCHGKDNFNNRHECEIVSVVGVLKDKK